MSFIESLKRYIDLKDRAFVLEKQKEEEIDDARYNIRTKYRKLKDERIDVLRSQKESFDKNYSNQINNLNEQIDNLTNETTAKYNDLMTNISLGLGYTYDSETNKCTISSKFNKIKKFNANLDDVNQVKLELSEKDILDFNKKARRTKFTLILGYISYPLFILLFLTFLIALMTALGGRYLTTFWNTVSFLGSIIIATILSIYAGKYCILLFPTHHEKLGKTYQIREKINDSKIKRIICVIILIIIILFFYASGIYLHLPIPIALFLTALISFIYGFLTTKYPPRLLWRIQKKLDNVFQNLDQIKKDFIDTQIGDELSSLQDELTVLKLDKNLKDTTIDDRIEEIENRVYGSIEQDCDDADIEIESKYKDDLNALYREISEYSLFETGWKMLSQYYSFSNGTQFYEKISSNGFLNDESDFKRTIQDLVNDAKYEIRKQEELAREEERRREEERKEQERKREEYQRRKDEERRENKRREQEEHNRWKAKREQEELNSKIQYNLCRYCKNYSFCDMKSTITSSNCSRFENKS